MKILTSSIARIIFAIPFLVFGTFHFLNTEAMLSMVPIPGGLFWVYFTGLALIAASVSIILNKLTMISCILLAFLLLTFIVTIHIPGLMNESTMQMSMMNLLKDMALMGAALSFAGVLERQNK